MKKVIFLIGLLLVGPKALAAGIVGGFTAVGILAVSVVALIVG